MALTAYSEGHSVLVSRGRGDVERILVMRGVRGFVDGLVSVLLAGYLMRLGFTPLQVGAIVTGTMLGSAGLTILLGLASHRLDPRRVLLGASMLMLLTGLGFASISWFWPLFLVAVLGTLNPSVGDVSIFLPTEQAVLAQDVSGSARTSVFARYNVAGTLAGGLGALAGGVPALLARRGGVPIGEAERSAFLLYAAAGLLTAFVYRRLALASYPRPARETRPLSRSRGIVLRLSALFGLDAFGGGFVVQSLLVLWLSNRFQLSVEATGTFFFVAGLAGALSQFVAPRLAARIGLIPTMVYTHLPANICLVIAGVVPSAPVAIGFLLVRALLSQMDVPVRQAYVMAVVPPHERAAAASVTNVPRSLAAALPPLLTGAMLAHSSFGWPLVCGGVLKALYDVLLLLRFRTVGPPVDVG